MRRAVALALTLTVLLGGCARKEREKEPGEGERLLWFTALQVGPESAALAREVRSAAPGDDVLQMLLKGPEDPELTSPFPAGTTGTWSVEEGCAYVDLSEAYGGLSGAELTLADGCIVLTLCQFSDVDRVYITVEGEPRPFRDRVFSSSDFLLDNALGEDTEE